MLKQKLFITSYQLQRPSSISVIKKWLHKQPTALLQPNTLICLHKLQCRSQKRDLHWTLSLWSPSWPCVMNKVFITLLNIHFRLVVLILTNQKVFCTNCKNSGILKMIVPVLCLAMANLHTTVIKGISRRTENKSTSTSFPTYLTNKQTTGRAVNLIRWKLGSPEKAWSPKLSTSTHIFSRKLWLLRCNTTSTSRCKLKWAKQ